MSCLQASPERPPSSPQEPGLPERIISLYPMDAVASQQSRVFLVLFRNHHICAGMSCENIMTLPCWPLRCCQNPRTVPTVPTVSLKWIILRFYHRVSYGKDSTLVFVDRMTMMSHFIFCFKSISFFAPRSSLRIDTPSQIKSRFHLSSHSVRYLCSTCLCPRSSVSNLALGYLVSCLSRFLESWRSPVRSFNHL